MDKKLVRVSHDNVVAGVCAGLARYFGFQVKTVRIAWIIFTLLGGAGLAIYIVLWILMPSE